MLAITFLGTGAALPETGGDSTCFLINDAVLIDTGWNAALRLPLFGHDPLRLTHLVFTHFHQDHCLGLPQLLFQRAILASRQAENARPHPLTLAGPAEDLEQIVLRTRAFLQADSAPEIFPPLTLLPLQVGDTFTAGTLAFTAGHARHPVPAHCYRIEDAATGATLGLTGDTEYREEMAVFLHDVDLLVAEATYGNRPTPADNRTGHMGATEAARLAGKAGAKRLALVHSALERRKDAVLAAQELFPDTFWPGDGQQVVLSVSAGQAT